MTTYRIDVVIDPTGAVSGVNVIEAKLESAKTKASGTKVAIQRAFDFATDGAVKRVSAVDKALDETKRSADAAGTAIDRNMSKAAAAAERAKGRMVNSNAQVRASQVQLGAQFNDFSTQVLAGGSAVTAFAQQSGQAAFALQGMNGALGTVGRFLAGPWGTFLIIGTTLLATFLARNLSLNSALDDEVEKLKDEAKEAETTRMAHERFTHTLEGVTKALYDAQEARKKDIEQSRTAAERANLAAKANIAEAISIRTRTMASLEEARARLTSMPSNLALGGEAGSIVTGLQQRNIENLDSQITSIDTALVGLRRELVDSRADLAVEAGQRAADPVARLNRQYDAEVTAARNAAIATKGYTKALEDQVKTIELRRAAALKAVQSEGRGDGVSRFTTRQQAIGIAGRELQRSGLRVDENEQFGGVRGNHPGMGNAAHGKYAIDVNVPGSGVEANDPAARDRFDEVARRYQARGYEVLWNGQFYAALGNGPTKALAKGTNQHTNHMHLQAPGSIVGRATQASGESQAIQDWRKQQQEAEAQADFISQIVDQAAQRGQPGQANKTQSQIERVLADFKRRFDREATAPEKATVTKALTDAEAREIALHFEEAYLNPLERLKKLQGETGITRKILNAQMEESERLGRKLTPVQAEIIANSTRESDALERQAAILESIRKPLEDYQANLMAIVALLLQGSINQTTFNSRISELGQGARDSIRDMPGTDPNTGVDYGTIAAREDEEARYQQELERFQNNKAAILAMGISYEALIEASHRNHVQRMNNIDRERYNVMLMGAQNAFESLSDIARNAAGEQSAIYIGLFAISKAFAIAQSIIAIQQGIAEAIKLGWPQNIPVIAQVIAQGASIIANIQAVALKFADGGYVSGRGGSRTDSIPAMLSNGEFVVNAEATKSNRSILEAINAGRQPKSRAAHNDNSVKTGAEVAQAGDTFNINVGDIVVNGGRDDAQTIGREVQKAIKGIVRDEIKTQQRSGGALTRGSPSVMAG